MGVTEDMLHACCFRITKASTFNCDETLALTKFGYVLEAGLTIDIAITCSVTFDQNSIPFFSTDFFPPKCN